MSRSRIVTTALCALLFACSSKKQPATEVIVAITSDLVPESELSRIEIGAAGIHLPAAALGLGMPRLAPFRLSGDVLLNITQLSLERGRADGDATLLWRGAGSALTPVSPLGEYEVRLKAGAAGMEAILRTLEGPLQLDGKGSWMSGAAPSFVVTARIPPQHLDQLAPLFRLIAVERGAGTFELQIKQDGFGG